MVDLPWQYEYSSAGEIFLGLEKVGVDGPIAALDRDEESWVDWYKGFLLESLKEDSDLFDGLEKPAGGNKFKSRLALREGHYLPKHQGR